MSDSTETRDTRDTVIEVRNLSKMYNIGQAEQRRNLQQTLLYLLTDPVRRARSLFRTQLPEHASEEFWALKDINFEVKQGDSLGIVGANGSGKSTLLKILSNIVQPSSGYAKTWGRVVGLLEVGTGFNAELTGRENVYLKGAYYSMTPDEIDEIYDDIVDFAGVHQFMDTPFKRYSSGMAMRLGFAVAAVMKPDIFIVDEVFAVGDLEFREKCIQSLERFHDSGGTLIVVSHSAGYINRLCDRAIWLEHGEMTANGPVEDVLDDYVEKIMAPVLSTDKSSDGDDDETTDAEATADFGDNPHGWVTDPAKDMAIVDVTLLNRYEKPAEAINIAQPFYIEVDYEVHRPTIGHLAAQISIYPEEFVVVTFGDADGNKYHREPRQPGRYKVRLTVPPHTLNLDVYTLTTRLENPRTREVYDAEPFIKFRGAEPAGNLRVWYNSGKRPGVMGTILEWEYIGDDPWQAADDSDASADAAAALADEIDEQGDSDDITAADAAVNEDKQTSQA